MRTKSTATTRVCPSCKVEYDKADYGRSRYCRRCQRDYRLVTKYAITADGWDQALEQQGGGCAICGILPEQTAAGNLVTHGDDTIRAFYGIVCMPCLSAIRAELHYAKSPTIRQQVLNYIESSDNSLI